MRPPSTLVVLILFAALIVAACGDQTPSVVPSAEPTPTPTPLVTTTPGSGAVPAYIAAAAALSADPRFGGFAPFQPSLTQDRWYEMTSDGATWDVVITVGWGGCTNGCVHRHSWRYQVGRDGRAIYTEESGEGLPPEVFPSPASGVARVQFVTVAECLSSATCTESVPGASFELTRFDATGASFQVDTDAAGTRSSTLPGGVYVLKIIKRPGGGEIPASFALSLAPGRDNVVTVFFAAAGAPAGAPAASPSAPVSPAP